MKLPGAIKGLVRNFENILIEDATILVVTGSTHQDIAALTGPDGTFSFRGLQPGKYVIKAYINDLQSDDILVNVIAKKTAFVEIWLKTDTDIIDEQNNFEKEYTFIDEI